MTQSQQPEPVRYSNVPTELPPAPPPATLTPAAPPTLAEFLRDVALSHDPHYYLAVLPADGLNRVESFDTWEQLLTRLRELLEHEVTAFPFLGYRLGISKPPLRHLVAPWGNAPLFDPVPPELELEDDGYLGKRYDTLTVPTSLDANDEDGEPAAETTAPAPVELDDGGDIFADVDEDESFELPT